MLGELFGKLFCFDVKVLHHFKYLVSTFLLNLHYFLLLFSKEEF